MPDVFLSYSREDQATARRFAEALERAGFSVWWDVALRSGEDYDAVTEQSLRDAKAVIVLWSKTSVASRWVRAEATLADRLKTLVPVIIEPCERPILFELKQTADLSNWRGGDSDPVWSQVLADVRRFSGISRLAPAPPVPTSTSGRLSVCVLPFANMSGDPEQEYFSDGISEDIITDLSKVSSMRVIARNSAFTFKGRHVDVRQVARELDVTHVLEGSVRKAANRVRITAQLIDGATAGHLWAERWDRELTDIFALQDEIAHAIVEALQQKLLPAEKRGLAERETIDFAAYDRYLRARALAKRAITASDYDQAELMLRKVITQEPRFASAMGQLTETSYMHEVMFPDHGQEARRGLQAAVGESLVRAPANWGTHLASGYLLFSERRWLEALQSYEAARSTGPAGDAAVSLIRPNGFVAVGRIRDAMQAMESMRITDPLDVWTSMALHQAYYLLGRLADATAEYERGRDLPGLREPQEHTAFFQAWDSGDLDRARAQFNRYLENVAIRFPNHEQFGKLLDQPEIARAVVREAIDHPSCQDGTRQNLLALYAGHFGDEELAVKALRRSYVDYQSNSFVIMWYPGLSRARRTPAFKQLARDLNLYDYWRKSGNWGDFARPVGSDDFECF